MPSWSPELPDALPGQRPSAGDYNRLIDAVENSLTTLYQGGYYGGAGHATRDPEQVEFWAEITANDGGTPRKYSWKEKTELPDGAFADKSGGLAGTAAALPAYETNSMMVSNGTIVRMYDAGNQTFRFTYTPSSGGAGSITFREDDGAPSVPNVSTASFKAVAFVISSPAANEALIELGYGVVGDITSVAGAKAAGASLKVARADHQHDLSTISWAVTISSTGSITYASGSTVVYQSGSTTTYQSGSTLTINSGATFTINTTTLIANILRLSTSSVSLTGTLNNYAITDVVVIKVTATTDNVTLTGMAGGAAGRVVYVENLVGSTKDVLVPHQDAGSDAANRFVTPTGSTIRIKPGQTVAFVYNATDSRWYMVSVPSYPTWQSGGADQPQRPTFNVTSPGAGYVTLTDNSAQNRTDVAFQTIPANAGGTGQTSYTKGDVLVATGGSTLAKQVVGTNTHFWVADSAQSTGVKYQSVNDLTADASPDGAADFVMTWDASASTHKKVLLNNLPGGGGGGGGGDGALVFQFSQTASVTVNNTGTETTLIGTGVGSKTLEANTLAAGDTIRIRAWGYASTEGVNGDNFHFRVKLGSLTLINSYTTELAFSTTGGGWSIEADLTVRTTGTSGTVIGQMRSGLYDNAGSDETLGRWSNQTSTATLNTVVNNDVDVTMDWVVSHVNNTLTCTDLTIEVLKAGAGGGGTPGGSDTQVQFNDGGSFGGDAGLTYAKSTDKLTVVGAIVADTIEERTAATGVTADGVLLKDGYVQVNEQAAPATPASGKGIFYAGTDSKPHFKNDAGTDFDLSAGGGGGGEPNRTWMGF